MPGRAEQQHRGQRRPQPAEAIHDLAARVEQREVQGARDADDDVREVVLANVVAEAERKGEAHLLELGLEGADDTRASVASVKAARLELDDLDGRLCFARALELAAPGVSQAAPDRVLGLHVDDEQVLHEPRGACHDLARVERGEIQGMCLGWESVKSASGHKARLALFPTKR